MVRLRHTQAASAAVTAVYLCLCRYETFAALLLTCTINPYSSLGASSEKTSMQVNKAPAESKSSTRSDKQITDYLSRHSAFASNSLEDHSGRQPLAALENLQAALSNLHVAYDLNKPAAIAGGRPMASAPSGAEGTNVPQYGAGITSSGVHVIRSNDMQAQPSRLQSHPIQCSPDPETASCSDTRKAQLDAQPACRLFQCDPGSIAAHVATSPSTPLQTDNHSNMSDTTEQSMPTLTCISTSATQYMLRSDDCVPGAQPAPAGNTPAAIQYTPDYTPSLYCTPCDLSPTYTQYTAFKSPPTNGKERWYTPGTNVDSCDSHDVSTHQTECALSRSHSLSRPDSPSLLYGQGSAFSADILGQENDISSQWLTT